MSLNLASFIHTGKKIGTACLDTFFPLFCIGCNTYGHILCSDCQKTFPRRLKQRCPLCFKSTTSRGDTCFSCANREEIDGIFAGSLYKEPLVSLCIHTFKYRFIYDLSHPLGTWLAERVRETDIPLPDLYIPVPLHSRRLRFRGFNQSSLLAEALKDELTPHIGDVLLEHCLIRTRYTKPQMQTTTKDERYNNLRNAFEIRKGTTPLVLGKSIWLIDDVSTTGTTLLECARVLKKAGAKNVFGIVLAR